jgi:hypothetical protein
VFLNCCFLRINFMNMIRKPYTSIKVPRIVFKVVNSGFINSKHHALHCYFITILSVLHRNADLTVTEYQCNI